MPLSEPHASADQPVGRAPSPVLAMQTSSGTLQDSTAGAFESQPGSSHSGHSAQPRRTTRRGIALRGGERWATTDVLPFLDMGWYGREWITSQAQVNEA
jgi:hypothetical protein